MSKEKTPVVQIFEDVEEVDNSLLQDVPEGQKKPTQGDPGWTEWMLSFLNKSEFRKHNGKDFPTTAGLQRLCTSKFGKIISSVSEVVDPASEANGYTCTVSHRLLVREYGSDEDVLEVQSVADSNERNTDAPFNRFLPPNASTRALGRCLRDIMQLQICTADELSNVAEASSGSDPEDAQPADDAQKSAIKAVSKKLGIDVNKLINMGPIRHSSLDKVLKGTARKIMSVLNGYQQGTTDIPDEIKI